jgi:hypothetical protein
VFQQRHTDRSNECHPLQWPIAMAHRKEERGTPAARLSALRDEMRRHG